MIFTRIAKNRGSVSALAMGMVLATGAFAAATLVEAPAAAQLAGQKKSDKNEKEKAPKGAAYSKAFVEAYNPLKTDYDGGAVDAATLAARVPALVAIAASEDEKFAAGQMAYNIGNKAKNVALQRQGIDMMLATGKLPPENIGPIYVAAGQLAQNAKDFAAARSYYEKAGASGYTTNDPQILIAETYFAEDNATAGTAVLDKAIEAKIAAGQPVPEDWLKRGLAMAYNAKIAPQAMKYGMMYARNYPSVTSWGDAINIQRNLVDYEEQELLDLMRLAQRTGTLRTARDYVDYIDAADARRLPGEVSTVVEAGIAAGLLKTTDPYVTDVRATSKGRLAADKAELPKLERDARGGSATAVTAMAAGDVFLGYAEPAKAEEFYTIALTKPGVDTARALTRLGIAQADQGKFAEAQATFAKVEGNRKPIAALWSAYAAHKVK